jgi:hypothetical protein
MKIDDVEWFDMHRKGDGISCGTTNAEMGQVLNADKMDGVE